MAGAQEALRMRVGLQDESRRDKHTGAWLRRN